MADFEVKSLELQVKSSADEAYTALDKLAQKLEVVAKQIGNVVASAKGIETVGKGSFTNIKNFADSIAKANNSIARVNESVAKRLNSSQRLARDAQKKAAETEKAAAKKEWKSKVEEAQDSIYERYGAEGANEQFDYNNIENAELSIELMTRHLAEANAKVEKLAANMKTDLTGKTFTNAVRDVIKLTNNLESARATLESMKRAANEPVTEQRPAEKMDMAAFEEGEETSKRAIAYVDEYVKKMDESSAKTKEEIQAEKERARNAKIAAKERAIAEKQAAKERAIAEKEAAKAQALAFKEYKARTAETNKRIRNLIGTVKKIPSAFHKGFKKASKSMSDLGKAIKSPIKLLGKLFGMGKKSGKHGLLGNRSFGQFAGLILLRRAISSLIRAVSTAIKEGTQNLAQYSAEFNHSISSIRTALLYLKNAFAVAFAPIVNVVSPYLEAFVSMIADAMNAVGRFMAALTGKGFAVQAKKAWSDYAKSLDKTADATNAANEAAEEYKRTIMSFDELHLLNAPNDSSSGAGGSGGSGDNGEVAISDMFTTVAITASDAMGNLGAMIRDAIQNDNWELVGNILTTKLSQSLGKINWTEVKTKAESVSSKVAEFINGAIDGLDDDVLSTSIGGIIETGALAVDTFFNELRSQEVGDKIGSVISKSIKKIPGTLIGHAIGSVINSGAAFINGFFSEKDYTSFGSKIAEVLNSAAGTIVPSDVGSALANIYRAVFGNIKTFFTEGEFKTWGSKLGEVINSAVGQIPTAGEGGLGSAIASAFNSAFEFVKGFVDKDGIKSIGTYITTEIGNFIKTFDWKENGFTFGEFTASLLSTLDGFFKDESWGDLGARIKEGIEGWFEGMKEKEGWESLGATIRSALKAFFEFTTSCMPSLEEVSTWISDAIFGIFKGFFEDENEVEKVGVLIYNFLVKGLLAALTALAPHIVAIGVAIEKITGTNPVAELQSAIEGALTIDTDAWNGGSTTHESSSDTEHGGHGGSINGPQVDVGNLPNIPIIGSLFSFVDNIPEEDKKNNPIDKLFGRITDKIDSLTGAKKEIGDMKAVFLKSGKDPKFNNTLDEMKAKFNDKEKAKGFNNTITGMKAELGDKKKSKGFDNNVTGMKAILSDKGKGSGFNNRIGGMKAILADKDKASGFNNRIGGMKAILSDKDKGSGFNSNVKDMVAQFSHWDNKWVGTKWSNDVGNMVALFDHWSDKGQHWSKDVGGMVSLFDHWDKKAGFNNTVDGMKLTADSVDYTGNPVINKPFTIKARTIQAGAGEIKILPMAEGGFVNTGTLFLAREAGPEMVGKVGHRTSVANNDQIVEAVSAGVESAVANVLMSYARSQKQSGGDVILMVDSVELARGVQKGQQRLGKMYSPTVQMA